MIGSTANRAGQESEPFAFCFTDVNGKPIEFCDHPKHAAEGDTRIRTPLYTHPASADDSKHHAVSQGVTGAGDGGQHIDDIAVDRFAEAMKQKLAKQRQKGYGGWNDKELCPDGRLQKYLGAHLGKGDPVDIGNFAMMIWNRGESVTDAGVPDADYIRALQDALDIIQADANTEENYDSLRRIGSVLANIKAKQEQGQ